MRKFLFALAMLICGASALQQARADVSVDYFYDNLSGGNWIEVEGYGYGWQPDLAVNDSNWRPYADGYWAYTDDGWTWISYEDFGWATYHYGRWANLADYGWTWFPGTDLDWGPAWVSWRSGGDYVGWAPLPPRGPGVVYEGRPIGPQVDIEFDIGPEYYNFCEVRYIGEPVLRNYIAPRVQNVTYINNTVNVTNITVQNNVVYNYGPNYETLSAHSNRPIQRLNIERQSATNLSAAAKSGALTKVQGNKLLVAAPAKLAKAPPTAKPPAVKTKVAQPKLNRGWAGVPNEAQLKQKIKTENPKNVPPPTGAAARGAGSPPPAVGAGPTAPAAGGAPPISPGPRGKPGRGPGGAAATPAGRPAGGASPSPFERGKRPGGPGGRPQPGATTSPAGAPVRTPMQSFRPSPPPPEQGRQQRGRFSPAPKPGQTGGAANTPEQGRGKAFGTERGETPPPAGPGARERRGGTEQGQPGYGQPGTPPGGAGPGEARGGKERGQPGAHKPPTTPPAGPGPGEARGGRERGQGAYGQPAGQPKGGAPAAAEQGQGQGKPERGKKKGEGTPPPRP
ncbi:MAG: hypothetical protein Udaeo2_23740 [Candidatus Udaeobacter sp.]|nr:MAG: hypothetical protein Udaeo2_23740 [Candidatus Udaeobacter sp.]